MDFAHELARDLLAIQAVQINPKNYFTWTSGIKSPIYCDNRLTISDPVIRKKITSGFRAKIKELGICPDVIAGCATAGIPHAAWLADELALPLVYVRSKPKGHGKGNQIEGSIQQGQKVLVIEDLISTGGSSLQVVKALAEAKVEVIGVMAIFTYGLVKALENFSNENINITSLTGFDPLLDTLEQDNVISNQEKVTLLSWRNKL